MSTLINSTDKVKGANDVEYAIGYTAEEVADFVQGYYKEGLASNYGDHENTATMQTQCSRSRLSNPPN